MAASKSKGNLFLASSLCDGLEDNNIKQVSTLLLNKEANPNTFIPIHGVTPFHLVIGNDSETFAEEVTKLFLRHGGDPNVRSREGLTPVHVAAAWGRVKVLELLLANGGDPLCLDEDARTPFHYAFDGKYYKAIVVLGKYCDSPVKEEEATKYKMAFDKLLINNGNIVAEYVMPDIPDKGVENTCNKDVSEKYDEEQSTNVHIKSFNANSDTSLNSDDEFEVNTAEFRIYEEMDKEKSLVRDIIHHLHYSIRPVFNTSGVTYRIPQPFAPPPFVALPTQHVQATNMSSNKAASRIVEQHMKDVSAVNNQMKKRPTTPRYRRKAFKQNINARIPLTPTNDSIVSKSPNFLTSESVEKRQKYFSPEILHEEPKFKAFTPCIPRNRPFQIEYNFRKDIARSTPRRRKQTCRQYSSRKLITNDEFTSPESISSDSTNSLSPELTCAKKSDFKLNKNIAIKLHESKYDDIPTYINSDENKENNEKYKSEKNPIKWLNSNFRDLEIEENKFVKKNEENLEKHMVSPEKFYPERTESKINNTSPCKENLNISLQSFKSHSYVSVQEEYKYRDPDEGIAFLERRIYTLPEWKSTNNMSTSEFWPQSLNLSVEQTLTNQALRRKLINLGDNPGPITNTTRQLYLKRLTNLENKPYHSTPFETDHNRLSLETDRCEYRVKPFLMYGDWVKELKRYKVIEKNAFKEFSSLCPTKRWREGTKKISFNYLLLDPRITKNFATCSENMTESASWSTFLSAIFYVGKGIRNRPYFHFKDAFHAWVSNKHSDNTKVQRILNIWNAGYGVVCLFVFQNTIPVEAYTREAAMIDALGTHHLKNCKGGDYYGMAATWNIEEKRNFGRYLLYQAMKIFMYEGERQIFPQHL